MPRVDKKRVISRYIDKPRKEINKMKNSRKGSAAVLLLIMMVVLAGAAAAKTLEPLPPEKTVSDLKLCKRLVDVKEYREDTNVLVLDVYEPERYSGAEVETLAAGDVVKSGGEEYKLIKPQFDREFGILEDSELGISLFWDKASNTFLFYTWDKQGLIKVGTLEVPIRDSLLVMDSVDGSTGESLTDSKVYTPSQFLEVMKNEAAKGGIGFASENVDALFGADGELALLSRYYTPWQ